MSQSLSDQPEEQLSQPDAGEKHTIPCRVRIRSCYSQLTDSEQQVADYVLANSGRVLTLSISEVAQNSGVGLGTVNRFCVRLGYRGYPDFKLALGVELLSPQPSILEPIDTHDPVPTIFEKTLRYAMQSLQDTTTLLDVAALERAAHAVAHARRVEFYAAGGLSAPIAMLAQFRFMNLGIPSAVFTEMTQQTIAAGLLGSEDIAIGLSNSGESEPTARALHTARQSGVLTIGITSVPDSPLVRASDIVLLTAAQEQFAWTDTVTSRIPMLGVIEALYASVALIKHRQQLNTELE
jgi:DNA-binding MurR/RpiR family transcriptional regulator